MPSVVCNYHTPGKDQYNNQQGLFVLSFIIVFLLSPASCKNSLHADFFDSSLTFPPSLRLIIFSCTYFVPLFRAPHIFHFFSFFMPSCALSRFSFVTFLLSLEDLFFLSFFVHISISNDVTVLLSFDNLISSSNNYCQLCFRHMFLSSL